MKILVTGAAGYIGSVVTAELVRNNHQVVALDNLKRGHLGSVSPQAEFIQADLFDSTALQKIFSQYSFDIVLHLAAESIVSQSLAEPATFYHANVVCSLRLLETMLQYGVKKFIFSSSAAAYGEPEKLPVPETAPTKPVNPYGETKLFIEKALRQYNKAYGLQSVSFRYFNAAGATDELGENHQPETHLIPCLLRLRSQKTASFSIYGDDYDTPDGSCVRDYVHVRDIAAAHLLALAKIDEVNSREYNLGTGRGYSVKEIVRVVQDITGIALSVKIKPRRAGDIASIVADCNLAKNELGWEPHYSSLEEIVGSAWKWYRNHPGGY